MIRALILVLLFSQCAFGQKAGSVAAYRQQYENEMASLRYESEWNSAKKLCKYFDPIEYKDTKQDFSPHELPEFGIGHVQGWTFRVVSVVDETNSILSLEDAIIWLEDFSTDGLSDGEKVCVLDPVKFLPTKKYTSASGASRTVKAFKMIGKDEFAKHKAKQDEDAAKQARKKREAIAKTFIMADGKTVKAVFIDIRKGKVILEGLDGEAIEHVSADFDAKSASLIRELFKNKPKEKQDGKQPAKTPALNRDGSARK